MDKESQQKPDKKKVSIVIVTYNAENYIPYVLASVEKQTFRDFNVLVIDNASLDQTVDLLQTKYFPLVKVSKQKDNSGFSRGYNLGIHWTDGDYILIMNQDVVLDSDFLELAVKFLDCHPRVAVLQGKIMQWEFVGNRKKDIIDNIGVAIHKNLSFTNRLEGEASPKQESSAEAVFAFSGSCVLLRRSALKQIVYQQEFFDELFFMYKEDIDLSWRLRQAGWDIVYLPTAVAYHARTIRRIGKNTNREIAANRYNKNHFFNYLSYRNHLYLLLKNLSLKTFLQYFFPIIWYELKKLLFVILTEPKTLKAYYEVLVNIREIRKKRKRIFSASKLSAADFSTWISQ